MIRNRIGKALMMRPATTAFFETSDFYFLLTSEILPQNTATVTDDQAQIDVGQPSRFTRFGRTRSRNIRPCKISNGGTTAVGMKNAPSSSLGSSFPKTPW
jgi:hypothetical protein